MKYVLVVRLLLTALCLFYVHQEAGLFVAIALALVAATFEFAAFSIRITSSYLRTLDNDRYTSK